MDLYIPLNFLSQLVLKVDLPSVEVWRNVLVIIKWVLTPREVRRHGSETGISVSQVHEPGDEGLKNVFSISESLAGGHCMVAEKVSIVALGLLVTPCGSSFLLGF